MQGKGGQGKALARFKHFAEKRFENIFVLENFVPSTLWYSLNKLLLSENILVENHSPMTGSGPRLRNEEQRRFEPVLLS